MLLAVMLILMGLLRALASPLILIGTVILSFAAALGISGVVFDLVYDRPHTDPGSRCTRSCSWSPWASTTTSS